MAEMALEQTLDLGDYLSAFKRRRGLIITGGRGCFHPRADYGLRLAANLPVYLHHTDRGTGSAR